MSETTDQLPTPLDHSGEEIVAKARRAEAWAGEAFLREGEEPMQAMASGTARRRALDDAIAEIEKGNEAPSPEWKVRYALMLGLERVLSEKPPHLASGLELRRHQVDALAGMLTELIAASQRKVEAAFSNGHLPEEAELEELEEEENGFGELHPGEEEELMELMELTPEQDPGAIRRFRFRHPTASGKTIAAAGFVEAARTLGVLILTHRRLLVSQFRHDLTETGYAKRFTDVILRGHRVRKTSPITIQTYAWFARHHAEVEPTAYQLVICDEAHTALGEKTSAAIRAFPDPIFIGMTATEQLIAKQVSDVFPASVDDLPLQDAARRGLIAPLRCLRVPPVAAIHSVPIVGGDFDERALAQVLDHTALNQAAASLYRDRFDDTPGIVYAAGVDHAYNLAQEFRAAGLKAEAVSGRTPPVKLAETLAAYERGEINVLINAQLLAEGWNSPRATVCMHLAPTASRRVYQQRIGRIMRTHPRKEAGVVVDFVPKSATHSEKVISIHSLLGADFYREGARVTPAPRRRMQRRARRRLAPASWLVPVTPDVKRRLSVIAREWQRIDPKYLDTDEQRFWAMIAGRSIRYEERAEFVRKLIEGNTSKVALEQFLFTCAAENANRRLRLMALVDRVATPVERADYDDLVTLVTQAPTWEKERLQGIRVLLRALAEGKANAPEQILVRWLWRLARASRKAQDRKASAEFADAKRLLGAVANSRGRRHEENVARLVNVAREQPLPVGTALLASAEGYTPRATQLIEAARERLAGTCEIAAALAENLPAPKLQPSRRRRRRKRRATTAQQVKAGGAPGAIAEEKNAEPAKKGTTSSDRVNKPTDARATEAAADGAQVKPSAAPFSENGS